MSVWKSNYRVTRRAAELGSHSLLVDSIWEHIQNCDHHTIVEFGESHGTVDFRLDE